MKKFHLGIYALIEQGPHILLVKKSRGPYRNTWDLPGGRPLHGETLLQTLQREVLEETGVRLLHATPHSNHVHLVDYTEGQEAISLHHTCLIYTATQFDASQFRAHIDQEDVTESAWLDKAQCKHLPLSKVAMSVVQIS